MLPPPYYLVSPGAMSHAQLHHDMHAAHAAAAASAANSVSAHHAPGPAVYTTAPLRINHTTRVTMRLPIMPNGVPVMPNGMPIMPNGMPIMLNSMPNGMPAMPNNMHAQGGAPHHHHHYCADASLLTAVPSHVPLVPVGLHAPFLLPSFVTTTTPAAAPNAPPQPFADAVPVWASHAVPMPWAASVTNMAPNPPSRDAPDHDGSSPAPSSSLGSAPPAPSSLAHHQHYLMTIGDAPAAVPRADENDPVTAPRTSEADAGLPAPKRGRGAAGSPPTPPPQDDSASPSKPKHNWTLVADKLVDARTRPSSGESEDEDEDEDGDSHADEAESARETGAESDGCTEPSDGANTKPGTVRMRHGRWTAAEHQRFIKGLKLHGSGNWALVAKVVASRTTEQTRSHAQKQYFRSERQERKRARIMSESAVAAAAHAAQQFAQLAQLSQPAQAELGPQ